ncbi:MULTISPECIES: transporter substrate-binding domain-containing protein [unclassified Paenibacillus]|uniref:transporter substrate-binding domain-containing protein n=1 Tax=unclassified Paenibacillus TaxID=185978 RepID=UPI001C1014E7|nr:MULTISPECIES: transporter substrate-binding domain-containing protein [unclassified Paenibacillus]MBU5443198.1 transporter substrate-binding domain-containing protein [Paenibacillus sp. MSJ-34]CAH0121402.1 Arginine-binding extracellular protein ArtP [Paenibacillus sp. CECT 9249]
MKKIAVAIIASLFIIGMLAGCGAGAADRLDTVQQNKRIVLGTSADYPPYEFHKTIDGKDQIVGFDIEIAKAIADDLGVELVVEDMNFDSLLIALNTGKVDMVISGMNPTEKRKKNVDFSNIYYTSEQAVLVRSEDRDRYQTMDDLAGAKIGAQKTTIYEDIARSVPDAKVEALSKVSDLVLSLEAKRIDAIVLEMPVAAAYSKSRSNLAVAGAEPDSGDEGFAIAVKKGSAKLAEQINQTLDRLTKEQRIEQFVTEATKLAETD